MDPSLLAQALLGLLALVLFYKLWIAPTGTRKTGPKEPPQPPGAWPIIGHIPLLGSYPNMGRVLKAFADEVGPVFMIRVGMHRKVVVNSWEAARECFTTNDRALASRSTTSKYMPYNYAMMNLAPYGPYWRQVRKVTTKELLSNSRLDQLKHVRASEINSFIKDLYALWVENGRQAVQVEMGKWFSELTMNVVIGMVAGKRYFGRGVGSDDREAQRFRRAIPKTVELMGSMALADVIPFLKWLGVGRGPVKAMQRTVAEVDAVLSGWLREHRARWREGDGNELADFMSVMLSVVETQSFSDYDPDTVIKANCLAFIIGASDASIALAWSLALLLNHPHVLTKAREELDAHVGHARHVDESDIKDLAYIPAIVKEALRMYPPGPILVPHHSIEDCQIAGFHVQAGTELMVNAWGIQRDPRVWPEPDEFKPERFLSSNIDVRGQHYELIPFSSGRRSCPGMSLAIQLLHLTLARLIHGFDMVTPSGGPVDMTEGASFDLPMANAFQVMFSPRLPSQLYG